MDNSSATHRDTDAEATSTESSISGLQGLHADRLVSEARDLRIQGHYKLAEEKYHKALDLAESIGDNFRKAQALNGIGNSQVQQGLYRASLSSFERLLGLAEQGGGGDQLRSAAYNGIGVAYKGMGEYRKAIEYHEKDLAIAQELDDRPGQGTAYGNLGNAYYRVGEYRKAIEYHEKDLAITQELGNRPDRGRTYGNLGVCYDAVGEYRNAIEYHTKCLTITEELGDRPGQGRAYGNLGNVYYRIGEYRKAIEYLEKDLAIAQELGDRPDQGAAYSGLGSAYRDLGEYRKAIEYHKKHLEIAQELGDKPDQGRAYGNLGDAYNRVGEHRKAIKYHEKDLAISQELGDRPGQGVAYSGLGNAYRDVGDYRKAIEYHEKDLVIAQELGNRASQGAAYGNLGVCFSNVGEYRKAIEYHEKDLAIAQELGNTSGQVIAHVNMGWAHWDGGDSKSALTYFRDFGELLHSLERQLKEGDWRKYILAFLERYGSGMDGWVVAAAREGEMTEALRVEEWRRCRSELAYLSEVGSGASVEPKDLSDEMNSEGLAQMIRNTGASYLIVLKLYRRNLLTWVLSGETGELVYSRLRELREKDWTKLTSSLLSVSFAEWSAWRQGFEEARRLIEASIHRKQDLDGIRKELCENCFPDYLKDTVPKQLWEGLRDPTKINKYLDDSSFMLRIQRYFLKKAEAALGRFSRLIWDPIIDNCNALRNYFECDAAIDRPIYFLGDPLLSMIPFGGFSMGENLLIEKTSIAQASSLRTLDVASTRWRLIRKKQQSGAQALVVSYGNSVTDGMIINESKDLSKLFGTPALSGDEATKDKVIERIRRDPPCLLHVLAHGIDVDESEWTGIQLAQNTVLTAAELNRVFTDSNESRLVLPTRLMTLCCCSSGLGVRMGEGVQGFARAALAGGCPCLLASKWDIPTKESLHFMKEFYRELAAKKGKPQTVAQALRNAVVALRKNEGLKFNKNLFYWAAFVPHGYADVQLDDRTMESIRAYFKDYNCPEESKLSDRGTASTSGVSKTLSAWDSDDVEKMWKEWNDEYSNAEPDSCLVSQILGMDLSRGLV